MTCSDHQQLENELRGKRLDAGCLTWPAAGPADPLTAVQLWALIAGLEVSGWKKHWRR